MTGSRKVVVASLLVVAGLGLAWFGFNLKAGGSFAMTGGSIEWWPSETAPVDRPVYLVAGNFILPDGSAIPIPGQRVARAGWGKLGSTHIIDPERKPLPVAVEATWYALAEGTAYKGRADLPVETIATLFATDVPNPLGGSSEKPDRLVLGMGPGGDMAVWVVGVNGSVLIGMYPAERIDLDVKQAFELMEEAEPEAVLEMLLEESLSPEARAGLQRTGPLPGFWRELDRRFSWTPSIANKQASAYQLKALNGEVEWMGAAPSDAARAAPDAMDVYWRDGDRDLVTEIVFDRQETRDLFAAFPKGSSLQMIFELAQSPPSARIVLTDGIDRRPFTQTTASLYSAR
ncbi:MAG: DUF2931 family protein [Hoeflea sp.]|uniref:DUF2931 family protein n=1 Tax=Hoeflea sp. TaxID=1940281 RepID=UPI0027317E74|nr:DUF2931 family protein [Hoeflea sp.]MDP2122537.1 DUF2931 family protein [Hoeflea sp.]